MFALVDCNNFYASCERVFRPELEGRPVVVLSNNDGCVIARSNEAKTRGVPMGCAYFKVETLLHRKGVAVFSSNYTLYGDFSRRVMQVLSGFAPVMDVYSIDECFLDFSGMPWDLTAYALDITKKVFRWTGIPVSIGIGPTKTLAKVANRMAKKGESPAGSVLDWSNVTFPRTALSVFPVESIWGVSVRWGNRLRKLGIQNAWELSESDPRILRKAFGVVMERIYWELRGRSCLPLNTGFSPRRQILVSRGFGERLYRLGDVRAAVTAFATRAGEKLRSQKSCAQALTVFLQTSPFDREAEYANRFTVPFENPSRDTGRLIHAAVQGLERIFRKGYAYQKAGVFLQDLVPEGMEQRRLFSGGIEERKRSDSRMQCLDRIRREQGESALYYAGERLDEQWRMRQRMKSPAYTTRWSDLPVVK